MVTNSDLIVKGFKTTKKPTKGDLEKILDKVMKDNDKLAETAFKAGIILCGIYRAVNKMIKDVDGDIVNPIYEDHKKYLEEITCVCEPYKKWNQIGMSEEEKKEDDKKRE